MTLMTAEWTPTAKVTGNGSYFEAEHAGNRFAIISTAGSRAVAADPSLVGQRYIQHISSATVEALGALDWERLGTSRETRPHPLVILRGGATFSPAGALEAIGFPPGAQSFLTSESQRSAGVPPTSLQKYWKFENIEGVTTLLICDIVASGETVIAAVKRALDAAPTIQHIIILGFVTLEGAARIVDVLSPRIKVSMVAFEALFRLPNVQDQSRRFTTPCDFRRSDFICGPQYLALVANDPGLIEEQCVIYDGGQRAFAPQDHISGRDRYLSFVSSLSDSDYRSEMVFRAGLFFGDGSLLLEFPSGRGRSSIDSARNKVESVIAAGRRLR